MAAPKPDGRVGAASVEYGGLVLAGPEVDLLRRSNTIREQLWLRGGADPFLGRELRRLRRGSRLRRGRGNERDVQLWHADRVRVFADGRGSQCADDEYVAEAVAAGLATEEELAAMAEAWTAWGSSPASYAAFNWCRAVGRKPSRAEGTR